jgi:protein-tyrosine-phosphatase
MKNILVLCTGNSARSIIGEALLNRLGEGRVQSFSAGSHPKGEPHPAAIALLGARGFDITGFSSKSWDVFSGPDAPDVDIVITVCDNAEGETCPVWPGVPVSAHWGIADPAAVEGPEQAAAFEQAYSQLQERVEALMALDFENMDKVELREALNTIGAGGAGATDRAKSLG